MDDLIARLETATDGSRELDLAIAREVLGLRPIATIRGTQVHNPAQPEGASWDLKPYTTSLDAALTLAPEGYIGLQRFSDGWYAQVARHSADFRHEGTQKPAALALCIAALKALRRTSP